MPHIREAAEDIIGVGIVMGYPGVFQGYPDPDLVKTHTWSLGMGFYWVWVWVPVRSYRYEPGQAVLGRSSRFWAGQSLSARASKIPNAPLTYQPVHSSTPHANTQSHTHKVSYLR